MPAGWAADAACRGIGDVMTMPEGHGRGSGRGLRERAHVERAKATCRQCPVLARCFEWVLAGPEPVETMVAAGMTPDERRRLRRGP